MQLRTHPRPESIGRAGRWQSPYHDTMIDRDKVVGALLDKLDALGIAGTSWVGKLLQASGELTYVNEPLNPEHPPGHSPGVLGAPRLRYHVGAELRRNRSPYDLARMARYATSFLLGRVLGRRALVDDPYAMLASEWLADRVGCRVVVVVREPAAIAGSWKRLGWTTDLVSCCTSRP
jgi:hypothetical protein